MAKKQRVTRKKLLKEPDEFITTTGRLIRWSKKYQTQLAYAGGIFFVMILAVAGFRYLANQAENNASRLLGQAVVTYENLKNSSGQEKAYQETKKDFEQLLNKYENKKAGKIARIVFANISLDAGNADQAISLFEKALKDMDNEKTLYNPVRSSLAYAYESKQDYQKALSIFQAVADGEDPLMKDTALFNLGRLYGKVGDFSKSKEAFGRLVSDYTDSIYFEIAKEKMPTS